MGNVLFFGCFCSLLHFLFQDGNTLIQDCGNDAEDNDAHYHHIHFKEVKEQSDMVGYRERIKVERQREMWYDNSTGVKL